jgi:hypothetical protein
MLVEIFDSATSTAVTNYANSVDLSNNNNNKYWIGLTGDLNKSIYGQTMKTANRRVGLDLSRFVSISTVSKSLSRKSRRYLCRDQDFLIQSRHL